MRLQGGAVMHVLSAVSSVIGLRRSSDVTCGDFKKGEGTRKGGVEERRRGGEPVWAGAEG